VREKVKVLLVLYDGHKHAEEVPELLGTTENELALRKWLEDQGHTLVTTSDKEGESSKFDQELVDAEIIITTPYAGLLSSAQLTFADMLFAVVSTQATSTLNVSQKPRSSRSPSQPVLDPTTSTSMLPTRPTAA